MTPCGCTGCIFLEDDLVGRICSISDDYLEQMISCPLDDEVMD